jgi:hypothetical protein
LQIQHQVEGKLVQQQHGSRGQLERYVATRSRLGDASNILGALVKNTRDLGKEHKDWLAAAGRAIFFRAVPCATNALYDLIQDAHPKTLSCCVVANAQRGTATDVKWRKPNARIEAA